MTIGPIGDVSCFQVMNELKSQYIISQQDHQDDSSHKVEEKEELDSTDNDVCLSMGMSGDFETAIDQGASIIRFLLFFSLFILIH